MGDIVVSLVSFQNRGFSAALMTQLSSFMSGIGRPVVVGRARGALSGDAVDLEVGRSASGALSSAGIGQGDCVWAWGF